MTSLRCPETFEAPKHKEALQSTLECYFVKDSALKSLERYLNSRYFLSKRHVQPHHIPEDQFFFIDFNNPHQGSFSWNPAFEENAVAADYARYRRRRKRLLLEQRMREPRWIMYDGLPLPPV